MDHEDRLHLLLGRLVRAFSSLDFSLGLQLKHLAPYCDQPVEALLNARTPFAQRLQYLGPLLTLFYEEAGPEAARAFSLWMERAHAAKVLRNDYIHGRWGILHAEMRGEPMLEFVSLHWEMDPRLQTSAVRMGFDQLESEIKTLESLFADYLRLERRYSPRVTRTIKAS
jgi:hypothetical protein